MIVRNRKIVPFDRFEIQISIYSTPPILRRSRSPSPCSPPSSRSILIEQQQQIIILYKMIERVQWYYVFATFSVFTN